MPSEIRPVPVTQINLSYICQFICGYRFIYTINMFTLMTSQRTLLHVCNKLSSGDCKLVFIKDLIKRVTSDDRYIDSKV